MPIISMTIRRKKITSPATRIVCGNTDYQIAFSFDAEWDAYAAKTARFCFGGNYIDVVFAGHVCDVPKITNADYVEVGVFAGDLHTTTPGRIGCDRSILCRGGQPADPHPDVYAQVMELLNSFNSPVRGVDYWTAEDKAAIVAEVLAAIGGTSGTTAILDSARLDEMILQ